MAVVYLFSGQGSQYVQMGSELYEGDELFRTRVRHFDCLIADLLGYPLYQAFLDANQRDPQLLLEDPITSGLLITQMTLSLYHLLKNHGCHADKFVGSSLGTLIALVCAGRISEEDCIKRIIKQGAVFKQKCEAGSMIAVLAPYQLFEHHPLLSELSELAGINYNRSFVIAAPSGNVSEIDSILSQLEVPFTKLPVSRAYHSRWIDSARNAILDCYSDIKICSNGAPVFCSSIADELTQVNAASIWRAVRSPMYLKNTFNKLELEGHNTYVDIGPSGTLVNIAKQNRAQESLSSFVPLMTPFKNSKKNIIDYLQMLK